MDNSQSYLQELNRWADETKKTLENTNLPENENWIETITDWKASVIRYLEQGEEIMTEDLQVLQDQGQRILNSMVNYYQMDSVPYGKHQLPPLPYAYNALEPYISEEIMHLHHDIHHKAYVEGLNKAEKALYLNLKDKNIIKHWLREQAFNGSGHNLHTIFWFNMTPNSTKYPIKEIKHQLDKDFGSWEKFRELFTNVASSVEGVGWAVLLWNPRSGKLGVQSIEKHQLFQLADSIPLLVLDMWEHAYYLQYKTDKASYIKNWWNIVNWEDVNNRFVEAKNVKWKLY
ncbi:superoxide dismutase [Oceanobacillus chungangensis]|uniref:superoxide dismutase n=1 Tax=Oceanobacillus chungangensis TaxID=1229152 RepID=A0A3D8Q306_9BACI|nr:superoxide dismutase [Oceanobacillus chungangensis]RDW22009.1 superoxide dismutase [Oceanobacillus chungangensis]